MSTYVNLSSIQFKLWDQDNRIKKYESWFSTNSMLKDEIKKKIHETMIIPRKEN
jgi:hypothetical protein